MKYCSACGITLPEESFYSSKGKLSCYCKICWKERVSKKAPKRTKEKRKDYYLKAKYNTSWEEFSNLFTKQHGKCCICNKDLSVFAETSDYSNVACVDHNHTTGKIRGLLCNHCNTAIGLLKEDPELFKQAISYLLERGVK